MGRTNNPKAKKQPPQPIKESDPESESEYSEEEEEISTPIPLINTNTPTTTIQGSNLPEKRKMEISLKPQPNVSAFLTKLYNMVNDKSSNDLIHWSDDGKTFFVRHQEEFSIQVLPRFFKHGNFSSFVRQLNMYGFHKVPHVLQGLHHDEPEVWEFKNDFFQRDHPENLQYVKRKRGKQVDKLEKNKILDFKEVVSELSAIRQAQLNISKELAQLQQQNAALWQENMLQHQRYKQQEQTVDKILRFLASVFSSDKIKTLKPALNSPGQLKTKPKLFIEGSSSQTTQPVTARLTEIHDESTLDPGKFLNRSNPATTDFVHNQLLGMMQPNMNQPLLLTHSEPTATTAAAQISNPQDFHEKAQDLSQNLEHLEENLNDLQYTLGFSEGDLEQQLDSVDVDDFLSKYLQTSGGFTPSLEQNDYFTNSDVTGGLFPEEVAEYGPALGIGLPSDIEEPLAKKKRKN